ncbi:hypothetical protein WICMUC_003135 [Wickerhamomyces mucosus]|uniref:HECT-type E3 ubiquitin transferase n=1 Tax=Wickerhamomyces mucosus TaxID=1378264 RepID=A0A9P8PNE2_9ASCO|nr:hypothetical protein WICMUC_003135 [Wickerhamomyces mucosus]
MLNFNGNASRRRQVNLGGGFKSNVREQMLQKATVERERREKERFRYNSILIIQNSIKRYLQLQKFQLNLSHEFPINYGDNELKIYHFNLFFAQTFKFNRFKLIQINQFLQLLLLIQNNNNNNNQLINLKNFIKEKIYDTLNSCFTLINPNDELDLQTLSILLIISKILYKDFLKFKPRNFINNLTLILNNISISFNQSNEYITNILEIIHLYSSIETSQYLKFIANYNPNHNINNILINYDTLSSSNDIAVELTIDSKINILTKVLKQLNNNNDNIGINQIITIAKLISSLQEITLFTKEERFKFNQTLDLDDDEDNDDDNDGSIEGKYEIFIISDEFNQLLHKLYQRDTIIKNLSLLKDNHEILTEFLSSLLLIKPNWKSSTLISLIPNYFESFAIEIFNNQIVFQKFLNLIDEDFFFNHSNSELINLELFETNNFFISNTLHVFLELLKFRLFISNNYELFGNYGITRENFLKISIFLKKFVFNHIWNVDIIFKIVKNSTKIKFKKKLFHVLELTTNVIKQVYHKDSTLHVLNPNQWLIKNPRIDVNVLNKLIQEYDNLKRDDDGAEEDLNNGNFNNSLTKFLSTLSVENRSRFNVFIKTPFFLSFEMRVKIFDHLINCDQQNINERGSLFSPAGIHQRQGAIIRREHLLKDAFDNFNNIGNSFKQQLAIVFTNEKSGREAGVDGGGITKEFLINVVKEGFHNLELFSETPTHEIYPNPQISWKYERRIESEDQLERLNYIKFLGKVIGKCLYEKVLVDVNFAEFFLTKLSVDYNNTFDDLYSLDPELSNNLIKLLSMNDDQLESLGLTFTTDIMIENGKLLTVDLIKDGSIIPVTTKNRLKFIHELSNYKLNKSIRLQTNSFLLGLYSIIDRHRLQMFNPNEIKKLIGGDDDIDIEDLRNQTIVYEYSTSEPSSTIRYFWEILHEMNKIERCLLVKFVTSVPRAPLLGFEKLTPNFGIKNLGNDDLNRLPTASTCVNLLYLPDYQDKDLLREKLLYAIKAEAGFDLA